MYFSNKIVPAFLHNCGMLCGSSVCSQALCHEMLSGCNYLLVEDSSWDLILKQLNAAYVFTSYLHNICVKIIILLWYLCMRYSDEYLVCSYQHPYMKHLPLPIWTTLAYHIPFYLITWHGTNLQLHVFLRLGRDSFSSTDPYMNPNTC